MIAVLLVSLVLLATVGVLGCCWMAGFGRAGTPCQPRRARSARPTLSQADESRLLPFTVKNPIPDHKFHRL